MASWTLTTANTVFSLNEIIRWKANKMSWRYAKERDTWRRLFGQWALVNRIPEATGRRRVRIVRVYGKGQRRFDPDNLPGGMKPLIDALKPVKEKVPGGGFVNLGGLIVDDSDAWIELITEQRKGGIAGTEITLEDL
jgi:hypothetical protein